MTPGVGGGLLSSKYRSEQKSIRPWKVFAKTIHHDPLILLILFLRRISLIYLNSIIESASKEIRSRVGAAIITGCVLSGVAFSQPSQTISSFSNTQAIEVAKTAVTKGTGSGKQNPLDLDFAEVRAILHVNTDVKYFDENLRRMLTPEKIDLPPQFWFVWFCERKYKVGYKGSRTGVILEHPSGRVVSVTPYL